MCELCETLAAIPCLQGKHQAQAKKLSDRQASFSELKDLSVCVLCNGALSTDKMIDRGYKKGYKENREREIDRARSSS